MATVSYQLRGSKNPSPIYVRFSSSRQVSFRRSTEILINPKHFHNGKVRRVAEFNDKDAVIEKLSNLRAHLIAAYNSAKKDQGELTAEWLQREIDTFNGKVEITDLSYLDSYAGQFIENLPFRRSDRGERGVSEGTLKKYKTIYSKLLAFQKYRKRRVKLIDVDEDLRNELLNYFEDIENLSTNTAGRYLKFVKTICIDAKKRGHSVSNQLGLFKGFTEQIEKIHLNFDELEQIERAEFKRSELDHARDWLIIGCYIGQRIGDTLRLSKKNLHSIGEMEFIELVQEKTGKKVMVLVHPKVRDILDKREGRFPDTFANTRGSKVTMFNRYIKEVCRMAGIDKVIEGAKVDPNTKRKEKGTYPKWELITSHICRRSFATNYYGHVPTPFLMEITGHSREEEFLNYISRKPLDYAEQMLKYWKVAIEEQQKKSQLKVV